MKITELIEELQRHNPNTVVVIADVLEEDCYHDIGSFAKASNKLMLFPLHENIHDDNLGKQTNAR